MGVKNVTYILGAGASCKSQPLVSDMKVRMECLLLLLDTNSKIHINHICKTFKNKTKSLYVKYNPIVKEAIKHYTPDTYVKKLSLTGKTADLDTFKEFLNLYFLFEQDNQQITYEKFPIYKPIWFIGPLSEEEKEKKSNFIWDKIKSPIDNRYDVFFATLLKKTGNMDNPQLLLPSNYNIISWNYDNQLEHAYKEYSSGLNFIDIRKKLNINSEYDANKSHIIKINGDCTCWDIKDNKELTLFTAIEKLVEGDSINTTIDFAWEDGKTVDDAVHKIIEATDKIVIIGYSFPNFNRDVDKIIFSEYNPAINQIIIQVPLKDEYEKIKERIKTIKNISDSVFIHISDADQFYIPL